MPSAHASLAELKGIASAIPDQSILLNTLGLQEAKDSSAIKNIITAANYLNKLSEDGLLRKEKYGTGNYYINQVLFDLLSQR